MPTKVFFCEETGRVQRYLRRFIYSDKRKCAGSPHEHAYCNAMVKLDVIDHPPGAYLEDYRKDLAAFADDTRWPQHCERCGQPFAVTDEYQIFTDRIMRRIDTGEEIVDRELPPGACIDAWWHSRKGPDGRALQVVLPDRSPWLIDQRASNCTMPDDNTHRCWVRHGRPEDGTLHVDKNGHTCQAGAGSIVSGNYHGFLHNGFLTDGC